MDNPSDKHNAKTNSQEFGIAHPCGIVVSRRLREAEVLGLVGVLRRDVTTGYVWYDLPCGPILGKTICASVCFYAGALVSMSLGISDSKLYGAGWSDWSEEKEVRRAQDTERWLAEAGYPPGEYQWGSVWAGYDPKGGSGCGMIRFKPLEGA